MPGDQTRGATKATGAISVEEAERHAAIIRPSWEVDEAPPRVDVPVRAGEPSVAAPGPAGLSVVSVEPAGAVAVEAPFEAAPRPLASRVLEPSSGASGEGKSSRSRRRVADSREADASSPISARGSHDARSSGTGSRPATPRPASRREQSEEIVLPITSPGSGAAVKLGVAAVLLVIAVVAVRFFSSSSSPGIVADPPASATPSLPSSEAEVPAPMVAAGTSTAAEPAPAPHNPSPPASSVTPKAVETVPKPAPSAGTPKTPAPASKPPAAPVPAKPAGKPSGGGLIRETPF